MLFYIFILYKTLVMTQTLFLAPTIFKLMVLGGVLVGAFSQRAVASRIGLKTDGLQSHYYDNWLFNNLNFLIFLCTNFIYITTSRGLNLGLPDFQAKQDRKIALSVLAGPLVNIACACLAITLATISPAIATVAHFFAISQLMAALFTLIPFPPASGHFLFALALPEKVRHYIIESTPQTLRWERHVRFLVLWMAASRPTGQMLLHTILHSSFQILTVCAPTLVALSGLGVLAYAVAAWRTPKSSRVLPHTKTPTSWRSFSGTPQPTGDSLRAQRVQYYSLLSPKKNQSA